MLTGTWTGRVSDSSGSMMGGGFSTAMMNGVTWQITQAGGTFTGTMRMQGYQGGTMTVSGTINGTTGTFTMTVPIGTMMGPMMGGCMSTATGTFDMDDVMVRMQGTYAGANTCSGPFDHGGLSLTRQ